MPACSTRSRHKSCRMVASLIQCRTSSESASSIGRKRNRIVRARRHTSLESEAFLECGLQNEGLCEAQAHCGAEEGRFEASLGEISLSAAAVFAVTGAAGVGFLI